MLEDGTLRRIFGPKVKQEDEKKLHNLSFEISLLH
jgi:hypothetical protein